MVFEYNRDSKSLYEFLKNRAKKEHLLVKKEGKRIVVAINPEEASDHLTDMPVEFQGIIEDTENGSRIKGRVSLGVMYEVAMFIALLLIVCRTVYSVLEHQKSNIFLCVGVGILYLAVLLVIMQKRKPAKKRIQSVLANLNKK